MALVLRRRQWSVSGKGHCSLPGEMEVATVSSQAELRKNVFHSISSYRPQTTGQAWTWDQAERASLANWLSSVFPDLVLTVS